MSANKLGILVIFESSPNASFGQILGPKTAQPDV